MPVPVKKRWHAETKQFLNSDDPLILVQDQAHEALKQAQRNALGAKLVAWHEADKARQRQRDREDWEREFPEEPYPVVRINGKEF